MTALSTRDHIKLCARRLFARRGVDAVTTREIVAASEQRNSGSLHYYFGTKDALVRELIVDTARLIDDRRHIALDRIEAAGGPATPRDVLEVLVYPSLRLGEGDVEEDSYLRFISLLALQNRTLLDEVLAGGLNGGYQRCLTHLRRLLRPMPPRVLEERLVFMSIALRAILAAREASVGRKGAAHPFWTDEALANLLDALEGLLTARSAPAA